MTGDNTVGISALADALDQCSKLIAEAQPGWHGDQLRACERSVSLLEQCDALTSSVALSPEPVRTIHHFACTGGTLISKCLASIPNVQLLSEVDPLSDIQSKSLRGFHPTDLIQLLRSSSRGCSSSLEIEVFKAGMGSIYRDCQQRGFRLVLRDHAHSKYCVGNKVMERSSLRESLKGSFPIRSIVTVRHPLESYLSLSRQGWLDFEPSDIDEYSYRYLSFLRDHSGLKIFKYESFVEQPKIELQNYCSELELPFTESFEDLFGVHKLSGDSGRSSPVIAPRPPRKADESIKLQIGASSNYAELCRRLDYPLYLDS